MKVKVYKHANAMMETYLLCPGSISEWNMAASCSPLLVKQIS